MSDLQPHEPKQHVDKVHPLRDDDGNELSKEDAGQALENVVDGSSDGNDVSHGIHARTHSEPLFPLEFIS